MTLEELLELFNDEEIAEAALRGGILHGTEYEDQDPYK